MSFPTYFEALGAHVGPMSILHWIDDALMTLFFLLVGLEIKRELVDGHLSSWADRALPTIAAVSGMAVPAIVYLAIAGGTPGLARGWAIIAPDEKYSESCGNVSSILACCSSFCNDQT